MASKELIEQIEIVLEAADIAGDRYDVTAANLTATILAALQEPTEATVCAVDHDDCATPDNAQRAWRAMLNASPLGEQSE